MNTHARGPGAGWSWLAQGLTVANRNPWQIFGASALLVLCMALPFGLQAYVQYVVRPQAAGLVALFVFGLLAGGVLVPILNGGFMRVIDASRNGRPAHALDLFTPFRPGGFGTRLAGFGLLMVLLYVAFFALLGLTVGRDVAPWYLQLVHQQALGVPVRDLPALPAGLSPTFALLTVFFLFYMGAVAIGTGQVALRGVPPLSALRDGVSGAFKNVLPLVVLAACGIVALVVLAIGFAILVAILVLLGRLAGPTPGLVVLGVLYIVLMLLLYAFMMGVNYAIWHDVTDGGRGEATGPSFSGAQG